MTAPAVFLDVRVTIFFKSLFLEINNSLHLPPPYASAEILFISAECCLSALFIQTHGAMPQMPLINQKVVSVELLEKSVT